MRPVVTATEMRELDRATIEDIGLPALTLMETAGRAVAHVAEEMLAETSDVGDAHADHAHARASGHRTVAVVCGSGNNGGDGVVAARVLRDAGIEATVYLALPRDRIRGDAATHLTIYERAGGVVEDARGNEDVIAGADLVIDALFGVGLSRPIEGELAHFVETINRAPRCLALDIPSGIDADTGRVLGVAVHAEVTVTMAAMKVALASAPGFAYCGAVDVADIGIPAALVADAGRAGLVEESDVVDWLPGADPMDHKGRRGHVLIIGGMPGMRGAGRLCASSALRSGAGLVTLAASGDVTADDSIMTRTLTTSVGDAIAGKSAVVIGPGLGQSEPASAWVTEVLASGVPAVLDADALNLVAGLVETLKTAKGAVVLTPHPGEAARLLGTTIAQVEGDRLAAARELAAISGAVVVLKGARTIVCDGDFCSINPSGGPELATGGTGDVLAGLIGALLAQGATAVDAARAAVFIHGRAGESLATQHGSRGVISSDLPVAIAGVLQSLRG